MGYLERPELPAALPEHLCAKPEIYRADAALLARGSVWQCDECERVWVMADRAGVLDNAAMYLVWKPARRRANGEWRAPILWTDARIYGTAVATVAGLVLLGQLVNAFSGA
jgi:hypothetical protein